MQTVIDEVHQTTEEHQDPFEDLPITARRKKLKCYPDVVDVKDLAKTVYQRPSTKDRLGRVARIKAKKIMLRKH